MKRIDREFDLPSHVANRIKERFKALEDGDRELRDQISILQAEDESLKERVSNIEDGGLGVKRISDEDGDRIEFAPSDEFVAELTSDGVFKPIEPNVLKIGDDEAYLNDVVTANVTITSASSSKENIRELDPSMLDIKLPSPKIYQRVEGRGGTEIGFIAEELPEFLRRGNGYDLKALIAILALKVSKLEEELSKLKSG
ncbi:MAG: tail fiber domain-containing protein [Thaumarchaeota archaeon]|nr:tail fiber domain-containing protein [Nitrososphaerota archaeon]